MLLPLHIGLADNVIPLVVGKAFKLNAGELNEAVQLLLFVTVTVYAPAPLTVPLDALDGATPLDHA